MVRKAYHEIIVLIRKAADLARTIGIPNLLQPGLVKEMIIDDLLGHELIHSKRDADAYAIGNPSEKYEYLSCKEGLAGQLDRMFKSPPEDRAKSLERVTRNKIIYLAVFYKHDQTKCKIIYQLETKDVLRETIRQLERSKNDISHVGFNEHWAKKFGRVAYKDPSM